MAPGPLIVLISFSLSSFRFILLFQSRGWSLIAFATMPSITVSDGNTFKNWGPVTTTFTAPASCSTAGDFLIGNTTDFPLYDYATQCSTYGDYGCTPTGTFFPSLTIESNLTKMDDNIPYYSPGLYCPSGWATVGVAARDGDKTTSLSGILGVSTTTTTSDSWLDYLPKVGNPLTMLAELLDPGETLVMCCPRYVWCGLLSLERVFMTN